MKFFLTFKLRKYLKVIKILTNKMFSKTDKNLTLHDISDLKK